MSAALPPVTVLLIESSGRAPAERLEDWEEALEAYPGHATEHRVGGEDGSSLGSALSQLGLADDHLVLVAEATATPGPHLIRRMVEETIARGADIGDARVLPVELTRVGGEPRGYYVSDEEPKPGFDDLVEKRYEVDEDPEDPEDPEGAEDAQELDASDSVSGAHERTAQDGVVLQPRATGACCLMSARVAADLSAVLSQGPTGDSGAALVAATEAAGLDLLVTDTATAYLPLRLDWDARVVGSVDPSPAEEHTWATETHPGRLPSSSLGSLLAEVNLVPASSAGHDLEQETPFLSIVSRTQGARLHCLEDMLTCLAAQTDRDFEVLVVCHRTTKSQWNDVAEVVGGAPAWLQGRVRMIAVDRPGRAAPLNEGFEAARGRYVAVLDDDDTVLAHYVATFKEAAARNEGMMLRAVTVRQDIAPVGSVETLCPVSVSDPFREWPLDFHLVDHFLNNYSPFMSVAFPRGVHCDLGLRFDESLDTTEDWDFLVRAACVVGVASIREVTCVYRWWVHTASSREAHSKKEWDDAKKRVQRKFAGSPVLLPQGALGRFRALIESSAWETKKANDLARELATSQHEVITTLDEVKEAHDRAVSARDVWIERTNKAKAKVDEMRQRHVRHLELLREADELLAERPGHRPEKSIFAMSRPELRELVTQLRDAPVKRSRGPRLRSRG